MNEYRDMPQTIRQQIINLLNDDDFSAREISQAIGIKEKEVYDHLGHVSRSISAQNKMLTILPAQCLSCGYVFKNRKRFTRPSRCPRCKNSHIETPKYRIS
ncbi:MAG: transcriptional regulator [Thermodesulfobacteriota bacterium]|nr:transcriptional regulator [Thermodesulfobacteriota bacterium]